MIKPDTQEILSQMATNQFGKALRDFLDDKLIEIKDLTTVQSWEETLGRKFAARVIEDLFLFMREKKNIDKPKNPYI